MAAHISKVRVTSGELTNGGQDLRVVESAFDVESEERSDMLVAIQPSTGDILAVAQNAAAGDSPKALQGLYPPGSPLRSPRRPRSSARPGRPQHRAALSGRATIGTRRLIKNADFELGEVPLRTAFAQSCNTTFAALPPDPADRLGLNADFDIPGVTTEAGGVKPAAGTPEQVENGIGQGTVQASPFGAALMAAHVSIRSRPRRSGSEWVGVFDYYGHR